MKKSAFSYALLLLPLFFTTIVCADGGRVTAEQRLRVQTIVRKLEINPLSQESEPDRKWAYELATENSDLMIPSCPFLVNFPEHGNRLYHEAIVKQLKISGLAFRLTHPDANENYLTVYKAEIASALKVYHAILKSHPEARQTDLDDLAVAAERDPDLKSIIPEECIALHDFEAHCLAGDAPDCKKAAGWNEIGIDTHHRRDEEKAAVLYQRALALYEQECERRNGNSCLQIAYLYHGRAGVPDSRANRDKYFLKAATHLQTTCKDGSAEDCYNLAELYNRGNGVQSDAAGAASLYQRACELGKAEGCRELSALSRSGNGIGRDESRGIDMMQKACDLKDGATCMALALRYETGLEVAQDATKAGLLRHKACQFSIPANCDEPSTMKAFSRHMIQEMANKGDEGAIKSLQQTCELNIAGACADLADSLLHGPRKEKHQQMSQAIELYDKACRLGDPAACEQRDYFSKQAAASR